MSLAPTSGPGSRFLRAIGALSLVTWAVLAGPSFFDRTSIPPLVLAVLALSIGFAMPGWTRAACDALVAIPPRTFVVGAAVVATLVSYLLVSGPMRERPLSIDAAVYLFEARPLGRFQLAAPLPEPRHLFGGRFLFEGADGRLHGVFPVGFPLLLAPFAALSVPLLVGPFVSALLVVAQAALGRAIEDTPEGELGLATRLSVLLSLPSFARAVETADLLSHAWVAVLGATAIAFALGRTLRARGALLIGACLGWAFATRLLDGLVLTAIVFAIVAHGALRGRIDRRIALLPLLTMLPFYGLIFWQQKAATGSFLVPTQSVYFARSDWPPSCHRLGFGEDVGCAVEHEEERKLFGPEGYGLRDAFRVVRERASALGGDLLALPALALLGFAVVAALGVPRDALLAVTVVLFTVVYGLFYYGNSPIHGARHLFPVAPALWLLVARAAVETRTRRSGRLATENVRSIAVVTLVATTTLGMVPRWVVGADKIARAQAARIDVRGVIAKNALDRGLIVTADNLSWIAGFDPAHDGAERIVVQFDRSGLKDLRRAYPSLPVHSLLDDETVQTQTLAAPAPGLLLELERTWPSFVRPVDVGARVVKSKGCCNVEASGEQALFVFQARPSASLTIPFTVAAPGRYTLRLEGITSPDHGTWAVTLDDTDLPPWDGYDVGKTLRRGTPSPARDLSGGHHVLVLRCTGKREASSGYGALFDALIGTPEMPTP